MFHTIQELRNNYPIPTNQYIAHPCNLDFWELQTSQIYNITTSNAFIRKIDNSRVGWIYFNPNANLFFICSLLDMNPLHKIKEYDWDLKILYPKAGEGVECTT